MHGLDWQPPDILTTLPFSSAWFIQSLPQKQILNSGKPVTDLTWQNTGALELAFWGCEWERKASLCREGPPAPPCMVHPCMPGLPGQQWWVICRYPHTHPKPWRGLACLIKLYGEDFNQYFLGFKIQNLVYNTQHFTKWMASVSMCLSSSTGVYTNV